MNVRHKHITATQREFNPIIADPQPVIMTIATLEFDHTRVLKRMIILLKNMKLLENVFAKFCWNSIELLLGLRMKQGGEHYFFFVFVFWESGIHDFA